MDDAMVSARMSREKKAAGNRILAQLGTNASQAVNELYDYLIRNKKLPFAPSQELGLHKYTQDQLREAAALINELAVPDIDPELAQLDIKHAKQKRIERKFGEEAIR